MQNNTRKHIEEILNWLRPRTEQTKHSHRTLYDHLLGTYNILAIEGRSEEIRLAGLFHSIYGTSIFKVKTMKEREEIKNLIGEDAERLAWYFCNLQRPQCWGLADTTFFNGEPIPMLTRDGYKTLMSMEDVIALQQIEDANLREQQPDYKPNIPYTLTSDSG